MTLERRFVIGLADIRAITFQCKTCGGRVTVSPDKENLEEMHNCPLCSEVWGQRAVGDGTPPTSRAGAFAGFATPAAFSTSDAPWCFEDVMSEKRKRGPEPDELVLPGDWQENIRKALQKKRPASGWPKPPKKKPKKK